MLSDFDEENKAVLWLFLSTFQELSEWARLSLLFWERIINCVCSKKANVHVQ